MTLDRRALARGVTSYLAVAVPAGVVLTLVGGSKSPGSDAVQLVAGALVFAVAPVVAGVRAGRGQPTPYVHGGLSVGLPTGAYLLVWLAVHLAQGKLSGAVLATFGLYLLIAIGLGMLGGYLGFRRGLRATEPPDTAGGQP